MIRDADMDEDDGYGLSEEEFVPFFKSVILENVFVKCQLQEVMDE